MRVKLLGKYWTIRFVPFLGPNDGDCDHPETAGKTIRLKASLRGSELLETTIHEIWHAVDPHKSEEFVTEAAADMARILRSKTLWERINAG